jgi:hypothetical protein
MLRADAPQFRFRERNREILTRALAGEGWAEIGRSVSPPVCGWRAKQIADRENGAPFPLRKPGPQAREAAPAPPRRRRMAERDAALAAAFRAAPRGRKSEVARAHGVAPEYAHFVVRREDRLGELAPFHVPRGRGVR